MFLSYTGRPIAIKDEFENSNAVMQAWYIGEQGGNAMADLLFGDVNPTGKLCISFPRSVGHLPCYYNHRVSARGNFYQMPGTPEKAGRDYVFDSPKAFLPFGYGLSYTSYKYSGVKAIACDDGGVDLKVKIANVGERDGEEIVLAFIKREGGYPVPFEKELKAFKRVFIKAGKSKTVTLHLDKEAFAVVGKNYQTEYPKVKFTLLVGDKSVQIQR